MAELAVLTVVGSQPEAELLCSLLESEGIPCIQQPTNFAAGAGDGLSTVGPRADRGPRRPARGGPRSARAPLAYLVGRYAVEQGPVGRKGRFGQADEPGVLTALEPLACLGGVLVVALAVQDEVLDRF